MSTFAEWRRRVAAEQEPKSKPELIVGLVWVGVSFVGLLLLVGGLIAQSSGVTLTGFVISITVRFVYWVVGFFTPKWYPPFATPEERTAIKRRRRLKAVRSYARTAIVTCSLAEVLIGVLAAVRPGPELLPVLGVATFFALLGVGSVLVARRMTSELRIA